MIPLLTLFLGRPTTPRACRPGRLCQAHLFGLGQKWGLDTLICRGRGQLMDRRLSNPEFLATGDALRVGEEWLI